MASALTKLVGWILAVIVASVYCCLLMPCLCLSLWVIGVVSVFEWGVWRWRFGVGQYEKRNKLSVHPGEERGEDWRRARDTVRAKNFAKDSDEEEHFNIEWFLKMTTGLRPADLWERIKRKAEVRGSTIG
ncbi:unnamed protein product, partial [Ascophyllum nodosum]